MKSHFHSFVRIMALDTSHHQQLQNFSSTSQYLSRWSVCGCHCWHDKSKKVTRNISFHFTMTIATFDIIFWRVFENVGIVWSFRLQIKFSMISFFLLFLYALSLLNLKLFSHSIKLLQTTIKLNIDWTARCLFRVCGHKTAWFEVFIKPHLISTWKKISPNLI